MGYPRDLWTTRENGLTRIVPMGYAARSMGYPLFRVGISNLTHFRPEPTG